jgi:AraC-like ligand binding domain
MTTITYEQFAEHKRAEGFDEILERSWTPDTVLDTHTHPFAVSALMISGEMWLSCEGQTRHLRAGDTFELAKELPHAERYGPGGAVFWAARRHG